MRRQYDFTGGVRGKYRAAYLSWEHQMNAGTIARLRARIVEMQDRIVEYEGAIKVLAREDRRGGGSRQTRPHTTRQATTKAAGGRCERGALQALVEKHGDLKANIPAEAKRILKLAVAQKIQTTESSVGVCLYKLRKAAGGSATERIGAEAAALLRQFGPRRGKDLMPMLQKKFPDLDTMTIRSGLSTASRRRLIARDGDGVLSAAQ